MINVSNEDYLNFAEILEASLNENNIPYALSRVSFHSLSGTESITIPAPVWIEALLLLIITDLIVMAKSHDPFAEK